MSHSFNPMNCSPPGSSVHRILQARILEWVAISFSRGSSRPRYQTRVSCIAGRFFTIWAARKAHLCIHVFILPKTPLLSRLPHNIEQSSICYTIGPCWLSILNTAMYCTSIVHSKLPNYPILPSSPLATMSSLSKSMRLVSLKVLWVLISLPNFSMSSYRKPRAVSN